MRYKLPIFLRMKYLDEAEVEARFDELLAKVEQRETIHIPRDGKCIAVFFGPGSEPATHD